MRLFDRALAFAPLGVVLVAAALGIVVRTHVAPIAAVGAFAFVGLGVVAELRLRRLVPDSTHGRMAPWRHPSTSLLARPLDFLASSRLISSWLEPLPIAVMESDIEDVVYVSYLLEAEKLEPLVPYGLTLDRIGPGGKYALFSFLTYRHGHFGFRFMGPLRKLMPSPIQTNWRIHVKDPRTGTAGIYFVTNAIDYALPALAARLFTEGMPMHVFARSSIVRDPTTGRIVLDFDPGAGTAPDAKASLVPCEAPELEGPWRETFGDYRGFLEYTIPQNRAMSGQPWHERVTRHEIELPVDLDKVEPLAGQVESRAGAAIVGGERPACFRVAGLHFVFSAERHDPVR
jgi:hypothetical protein